jgi:hypothetical protein
MENHYYVFDAILDHEFLTSEDMMQLSDRVFPDSRSLGCKVLGLSQIEFKNRLFLKQIRTADFISLPKENLLL